MLFRSACSCTARSKNALSSRVLTSSHGGRRVRIQDILHTLDAWARRKVKTCKEFMPAAAALLRLHRMREESAKAQPAHQSLSASAKQHQDLYESFIHQQFLNRPGLAESSTPPARRGRCAFYNGLNHRDFFMARLFPKQSFATAPRAYPPEPYRRAERPFHRRGCRP